MSLDETPKKRNTPDDPPAQVSRRNLLKVLTGATAALAAGAASAHEDSKPAAGKTKRAWGMTIDLDRCTACGSCTVACRVENNVPCVGAQDADQTRGIYWMDMLGTQEGGYGNINAETIPVPCMHCEDPPCVKVCPVGATYKTEEGITAQIWDRCIGCRYCMVACPYSRRHFNWTDPTWSPSELSRLNPDVATRPRGVVEKCTFCHHRIRAVEETARVDGKPVTDAQMKHLPACAAACPTQAITFGDLNDPHSTVSKLSRSPRAMRLLEELGTKPRVAYLRQTRWQDGT